MESLFEMLSIIESDPAGILGNPSCDKLVGFLWGWKYATPEFISPPEDPHLLTFCSWLCSKYGLTGSYDAFVVAHLIAGNDHDAFFFFFTELNSFREINPQYFDSGYVHKWSHQWASQGRRGLVNMISRKPGLYLGRKNATNLRGFLDGDAYAQRQLYPGVKLYADLNLLDEWIMKTYKHGTLIRCEAFAIASCGGDQSDAYDFLMREIEKFELSKKGDFYKYIPYTAPDAIS